MKIPTHAGLLNRRTKGVKMRPCPGPVDLVDTRREGAGPRVDYHRCRSCGALLTSENGAVVDDTSTFVDPEFAPGDVTFDQSDGQIGA